MTATTLDRAELGTVGSLLGRGGQASVYLLPELRVPDCDHPLVFKKYRRAQRPPHGLDAIAKARSRLPSTERNRLDEVTSWPVRAVVESGEICGVVLPLIPDSFFADRILPTGTRHRGPREAQNLFIDPLTAVRLGLPDVMLQARLMICRDLATAIALLHRHKFVYGDINARNVLYRVGPEPTVMLLDCDAVRVRGSMPVVRQLNAPDWDPPDGQKLSMTSDRYKLGLFILRTLSPGAQASVARDPARVSVFDSTGTRLLNAALDRDPDRRPSADAWEGYLRHLTVSQREVGQIAGAVHGWKRNRATGEWEPARW